MSNRIEIQKRLVEYKNTQSVYSFETVWTVWADIETRSGIDKFSGIVVDGAITHIFKIRTISGLTSEYWVKFNNNRFKIESIETANEGQFMLLYCTETGSDTKDGSKS
jgi:SPP1 family predicted phage head-tail adaptor